MIALWALTEMVFQFLVLIETAFRAIGSPAPAGELSGDFSGSSSVAFLVTGAHVDGSIFSHTDSCMFHFARVLLVQFAEIFLCQETWPWGSIAEFICGVHLFHLHKTRRNLILLIVVKPFLTIILFVAGGAENLAFSRRLERAGFSLLRF